MRLRGQERRSQLQTRLGRHRRRQQPAAGRRHRLRQPRSRTGRRPRSPGGQLLRSPAAHLPMLQQNPAQSPAEQTLLHGRPDAMRALVHQSVQLPALCLHQRRGRRLKRQELLQQTAPPRTAQLRLQQGRPPLLCGATTKTASQQPENDSWPASAKWAMHEHSNHLMPCQGPRLFGFLHACCAACVIRT